VNIKVKKTGLKIQRGVAQTNNTGMVVRYRSTQILPRFTAQNFAIPGTLLAINLNNELIGGGKKSEQNQDSPF